MLGEAGRLKAKLCIDAVYFKNKKYRILFIFIVISSIFYFLVPVLCPLLQRSPGPGASSTQLPPAP